MIIHSPPTTRCQLVPGTCSSLKLDGFEMSIFLGKLPSINQQTSLKKNLFKPQNVL